MPTKKQLHQNWAVEMEYPSTRRTDDPNYVAPKSSYNKFFNAPVEDAEIISLRFISQLEKIMDKEGINRADLSRMLGTSKSYLTQLWRGDKLVNMSFLAKCSVVLGIKFSISYETIY